MKRNSPRQILGLALGYALFSALPTAADVLLDEGWADGDHTDGPAPVWSGHPDNLASTAGSLSTTISTNSMKVWTYFVNDDEEVTLALGEKLVVTVEFVLAGTLYDQTARGFRIGLYRDPTDPQVRRNVNSDGGGDGYPWSDATGYAVEMPLSKGPQLANPIQIFKRVNRNNSLLGSSSAMSPSSSGGEEVAVVANRPYTLTFGVSCVSSSRVDLIGSLADETGVLATQTVRDSGYTFDAGDLPGSGNPYVSFEQLFIRTTSRETSADIIEYRSIKVEHIKSPQ